MKSVILQSPFTFDPTLHKGEVFVGKSLTVPDESYSVRELYERFTTATPVDGAKTPIWFDGDHDSDDLEKLRDADPVVQAAVGRRVAEDIQRFEAELNEANSKAKADKAKAEQEAEDRRADAALARREANKPKGEPQK